MKLRIEFSLKGARLESVQKKMKEIFPKAEGLISVMKITRPETRAERLAEAEGLVSDAASIVGELREEMESWRDNLPENLQSSGKADELQEAADALQEIADNLEGIDFGSVSFPGMM